MAKLELAFLSLSSGALIITYQLYSVSYKISYLCTRYETMGLDVSIRGLVS